MDLSDSTDDAPGFEEADNHEPQDTDDALDGSHVHTERDFSRRCVTCLLCVKGGRGIDAVLRRLV